MDLSTLAMSLAGKEEYDSAGGGIGGLLVVIVVIWLLSSVGKKK